MTLSKEHYLRWERVPGSVREVLSDKCELASVSQTDLAVSLRRGRQKELKAFLAEAEEPPPLLHSNMAHHYRAQVEDLYAALQEDSEARRMEATDVLRSLVKEIVLTPDPDSGELLIEVHGDLAGILTIALERKKPAEGAGGSQSEMVAGTCSNQKLRTQESRPVGAAGVRDTGSQLSLMV